MDQPTAEDALKLLEPLVGEWTMHAQPPGGEPWPGEGSLRGRRRDDRRETGLEDGTWMTDFDITYRKVR